MILSFPRAGGPPNSLPKVDGAGDYLFLGVDRIFLRCANKNSIVPLASVSGLGVGGGPRRGGVGPRGGPPEGGGPPHIQYSFVRAMRTRRVTKQGQRAWWNPKTTFLAVFRGFGGYPRGTPPI
jgi:hypothetical protein